MNKTLIVFISLVFSFLSCKKEIEITIPVSKPRIVVSSTLVPFTPPIVKSLYLDIHSSAIISDPIRNNVIANATVLLFSNGKFLDTLPYIDSLKKYPLKLNLFPAVGDSLTVKVMKEGYESVYAQTSIPSRVKIDNIVVTPIAYYSETKHPVTALDITFDDPTGEINFYEIAVSSIAFQYDQPLDFYEIWTEDKLVTSESYYPSLVKFDLNKPKYLLFKDNKVNGQKHTIRVYYYASIDAVSEYVLDHYVTVHLRNVTEEYYKFTTTMIQQMYNREDDIIYGASEPLNVYTNIQNGYGIFAGFNNDMVSVHINKTKY